jgi:hypothetical protein
MSMPIVQKNTSHIIKIAQGKFKFIIKIPIHESQMGGFRH